MTARVQDDEDKDGDTEGSFGEVKNEDNMKTKVNEHGKGNFDRREKSRKTA